MEAAALSQYEIERGKPMPSKNHGIIQSRLNIALGKAYADQYEFIVELKFAPVGLKPAVPDLCIYPKMPVDLQQDEISVVEPPITAIEILSPKQSIEEIQSKMFNTYFPAGVQSAWLIVPPLRSVHIFTPDRKFVTFNSGSLHDPATGITLDLDSFLP